MNRRLFKRCALLHVERILGSATVLKQPVNVRARFTSSEWSSSTQAGAHHQPRAGFRKLGPGVPKTCTSGTIQLPNTVPLIPVTYTPRSGWIFGTLERRRVVHLLLPRSPVRLLHKHLTFAALASGVQVFPKPSHFVDLNERLEFAE